MISAKSHRTLNTLASFVWFSLSPPPSLVCHMLNIKAVSAHVDFSAAETK